MRHPLVSYSFSNVSDTKKGPASSQTQTLTCKVLKNYLVGKFLYLITWQYTCYHS
jgi:hypothetical protein